MSFRGSCGSRCRNTCGSWLMQETVRTCPHRRPTCQIWPSSQISSSASYGYFVKQHQHLQLQSNNGCIENDNERQIFRTLLELNIILKTILYENEFYTFAIFVKACMQNFNVPAKSKLFFVAPKNCRLRLDSRFIQNVMQ